jgi:hypothetical protein
MKLLDRVIKTIPAILEWSVVLPREFRIRINEEVKRPIEEATHFECALPIDILLGYGDNV